MSRATTRLALPPICPRCRRRVHLNDRARSVELGPDMRVYVTHRWPCPVTRDRLATWAAVLATLAIIWAVATAALAAADHHAQQLPPPPVTILAPTP